MIHVGYHLQIDLEDTPRETREPKKNSQVVQVDQRNSKARRSEHFQTTLHAICIPTFCSRYSLSKPTKQDGHPRPVVWSRKTGRKTWHCIYFSSKVQGRCIHGTLTIFKPYWMTSACLPGPNKFENHARDKQTKTVPHDPLFEVEKQAAKAGRR